jgi:putative ABC transport system permease protein
MIKNYFKIIFRNLLKNKFLSVINILSLAVGLACTILILVFVHFELSYDKFQKDSERVYRFLQELDEEVIEYAYDSPELLAKALLDNIPEIEYASRIMDSWADLAILSYDNNKFYQHGIYADDQFLEVLTFPILVGNRSSLKKSNTIILTESVATKLFGSQNPIGKTINYKEERIEFELTVTGVMKDIPLNSHLQFDYLISVQTLLEVERYSWMIDTWDVHNFITYVKLSENTAKYDVERKMQTFFQNLFPDRELDEKDYILQPIKDIHLRSNIQGELAANNQIKYVYLFLSIAIIVLLIASFNYMNLTTARSSGRAREIGIRKIVGADKKQLLKQFIGESVIISFISLAFALLIVELVFPKFTSIIGINLESNYLANNQLILLITSIIFLLGLLSGIYPAVISSKLQPMKILRDFSSSTKKKILFRSILIVMQFSVSVILIISTALVMKQLNYIQTKNLGYDREKVIVIPVREKETKSKVQVIRTELLKLAEVSNVSISSGLPMEIRNFFRTKFQNEAGEKEKIAFKFDYADENFVNLFDLKLTTGSNFRAESSDSQKSVLVNEAFVKKANWQNPIGKTINWFNGDLEVVGVLQDFHFASFHHQIEPMLLKYDSDGDIIIKYNSNDVKETLGKIKEVFEDNSKGQPFDYFFMDDAFNDLYQKEQQISQIFSLFATLAILISCSGLVGLVLFMVQSRTKEIGIRKVLGANLRNINILLSKEFIKLILIGNLIAFPIAFFVMKNWLQNFAYQTSISAWTFLLSGFATVLIALLMVGMQILKAANTNPVEALKHE